MYLPGKKNKYISFFLVAIIVFVAIAGAVISAPVSVYALSLGGLKGTIASLIISLMLQSGVAPVNNSWVNQLNNAYGVESSIGTIEDMITSGLLTESGGTLIDTGLSNAIANVPEYSSLGIDDIFTTVAGESGVIANSGAVNLANSAINVGTAGTIGAFAGAVAIGVGIGILANHIQNKYINPVRLGLFMDSADFAFDLSNYTSYMRIGYTSSYMGNPASIIDCAGTEGIYFAHGDTTGYVYNSTDSYLRNFKKKITVGRGDWQTVTQDIRGDYVQTVTIDHVNGSNPNYRISGGTGFPTDSEALAYLNSLQDGTVQPKPIYSPDLIGQNGNLTASPDQENEGMYNIPEIRNITPDGYDMTPVDMDDYIDYVDQANNNTENDDIGEAIQGQEFDDFVNPYFQPIPDEPLIPDDPVGPEQPVISPKPTPSPEEFDDVMVLTPDENLKDKFPFCIPFDIYDILTGLAAEREAPVITCPVDLNGNTITVDLSEFDSVAELLRLLELILFIIGLAVATRKLIGASGGG